MLTAGLVRQRGKTQTPGLSEIVFAHLALIKGSEITLASDGSIDTIATGVTAETNIYRFELPDHLGNYATAFNGRTQEHAITLNVNSESLNQTVWSAFQELEGSGPVVAFARGKKQGSDNAWRVLGLENGLIVGTGEENTQTVGTEITNLLTLTGAECTKPQWIELTAAQGIGDAFTAGNGGSIVVV